MNLKNNSFVTEVPTLQYDFRLFREKLPIIQQKMPKIDDCYLVFNLVIVLNVWLKNIL